MDAIKRRSPEPSSSRTLVADSKTLGDESGFTLIELLTAMTITLIVFMATLSLLDIAGKTEPAVAERNNGIREAQVALEQVSRELRQTYDVIAAAPTSITVLTYNNRTACASNASGTARQCRIVYSCTGGACTRTASEADGSSPGPAVLIASGLSPDPIFSFTPDASAPETITTTLTYTAGEGSAEDAITLSDSVLLRNIAGAVGG